MLSLLTVEMSRFYSTQLYILADTRARVDSSDSISEKNTRKELAVSHTQECQYFMIPKIFIPKISSECS